jgi:hypothetical protein
MYSFLKLLFKFASISHQNTNQESEPSWVQFLRHQRGCGYRILKKRCTSARAESWYTWYSFLFIEIVFISWSFSISIHRLKLQHHSFVFSFSSCIILACHDNLLESYLPEIRNATRSNFMLAQKVQLVLFQLFWTHL